MGSGRDGQGPAAAAVLTGTVVVGVDGSDSARHAAGWAAELASGWRVPLRLVHAAAAERPDREIPGWLRELADGAEREGASAVDTAVAPGEPGAVLLGDAADAGLLVVGSYGAGAHGGMLAGSTALALVDQAACPVAVVRGGEPGIPPPRSGPVVVGVDPSQAAAEVLGLAAGLADVHGAPLVAVHAWTDVIADARGGLHRTTDTETALAGRARALLEERLGAVRDRWPALAVEERVVGDTALRALLEQADHARAVVVGRRRRIPAGMLGSTSRGLVEFARCPVVVV
jgi:nucleotide-binding universal stress UspA family protein